MIGLFRYIRIMGFHVSLNWDTWDGYIGFDSENNVWCVRACRYYNGEYDEIVVAKGSQITYKGAKEYVRRIRRCRAEMDIHEVFISLGKP